MIRNVSRLLVLLAVAGQLEGCRTSGRSELSLENTASRLRANGWTAETYEVLFTNPVCPRQKFISYRPRNVSPIEILDAAQKAHKVSPKRDQVNEVKLDERGIPTLSGGFRTHIPGNVFCDSNDFEASNKRGSENPYRSKDSPIHRIQDWIQSTKSSDELFIASFSLSMASVANWTCEAAQRGVRVKVFMHEPDFGSGAFDIISKCPGVELLQFKSSGRLAHMKSIMVVYNNVEHSESLKDKVRVSFQSGNISSGTWGHHENWNFITQDRQHWLSQDHICLRDAITPETVGNLGKLYQLLDQCRETHGVNAARAQDSGIRNYFIPKSGGAYDDRKELDKLTAEIEKSSAVWIAAHHLTEPDLVKTLALRLKNNPNFKVRMLIDSELFWANFRDSENQGLSWKVDGKVYGESDSVSSYCQWAIPEEKVRDVRCSLFNRGEFGDPIDELLQDQASKLAYGPRTLELAGAELRMMESNHLAKMLFHNKIIIFHYENPMGDIKGSVFTGAGNLSKAGFDKNFENYYLVTIPHVHEAFRVQFESLFNRAAAAQDLPLTWDYRTVDDGYEAN